MLQVFKNMSLHLTRFVELLLWKTEVSALMAEHSNGSDLVQSMVFVTVWFVNHLKCPYVEYLVWQFNVYRDQFKISAMISFIKGAVGGLTGVCRAHGHLQGNIC